MLGEAPTSPWHGVEFRLFSVVLMVLSRGVDQVVHAKAEFQFVNADLSTFIAARQLDAKCVGRAKVVLRNRLILS